MRMIELLDQIADGKIREDQIIEFQNGYSDYCSVRVFFDKYIMDRENLNCEVKLLENKKIEKININGYDEILDTTLASKINEIIDYLEENK